jgi:pimeloyl-ACP methyl ester carboxylesterase
MMRTERGGFVASSDDTLVHFIDLDLHAEALRTEVNDPVVPIHGLGCNWHHWSRQIDWVAHSRRVVAVDVRGVRASGDKAGYESLDLPTAIIHGENDAPVPVQVPERVNPLLASARGIPKDLVPQR